MLMLEYAEKRLVAFLHQIEQLEQSDFPYCHSEEALGALEQEVKRNLQYLRQLSDDSNPKALQGFCSETLGLLMNYLPILGFVLRSTNVRNAFEAYSPLLGLARCLLGPEAKLVISSEWDYTPHTFLQDPLLPRFVLIGLPASESGNALLIPLAGHELGHSLWHNDRFEALLGDDLKNCVLNAIKARWPEYEKVYPDLRITQTELDTDLFAVRTWQKAAAWAMKQLEESFCDIVGLFLFGDSYAHAFAYLVSPAWPGDRSPVYPNLHRRAADLERAAAKYDVRLQSGYADTFTDFPDPSLTDQGKFLLSVADSASASFIDRLIETVELTLTGKSAPRPIPREITEARGRFKLEVPARQCTAFASILCAGWEALHDEALWKDLPQAQSKDEILREIILKSIEVHEIEQLMSTTP